MPDTPLSALLSQALVALAIDVDDEIERRLPHFTMTYGSITPGIGSPWLISVGMWFALLRFVGPGMITMSDLASRSGLPDERVRAGVAGLLRWGYVVHHADPNDSRPKPPKADWVVNPTANGRRWHDGFSEALADVESRWTEAAGDAVVQALRAALAVREPASLPPFPPILGADHRTPVVAPEPLAPEPAGLLPSMARALLRFAHEVEPALPLGLAVSANLVRVIGPEGALVRDVPQLSGVGKQEATTMLNHLVRDGFVVVDPKPTKRAHLTDAGLEALAAYERAAASWDDPALRAAVGPFVLPPRRRPAGDGWRARVKTPVTFPHFPVVTGHGGFPDGS